MNAIDLSSPQAYLTHSILIVHSRCVCLICCACLGMLGSVIIIESERGREPVTFACMRASRAYVQWQRRCCIPLRLVIVERASDDEDEGIRAFRMHSGTNFDAHCYRLSIDVAWETGPLMGYTEQSETHPNDIRIIWTDLFSLIGLIIIFTLCDS